MAGADLDRTKDLQPVNGEAKVASLRMAALRQCRRRTPAGAVAPPAGATIIDCAGVSQTGVAHSSGGLCPHDGQKSRRSELKLHAIRTSPESASPDDRLEFRGSF
jgi:hypothetical protein